MCATDDSEEDKEDGFTIDPEEILEKNQTADEL